MSTIKSMIEDLEVLVKDGYGDCEVFVTDTRNGVIDECNGFSIKEVIGNEYGGDILEYPAGTLYATVYTG